MTPFDPQLSSGAPNPVRGAATLSSEADVSHLVAHLNEVIFRTDTAGHWVFLNAAWTRLTGFAVNDVLGHFYWESVVPEDQERSREGFQPVIRRERESARLRVRITTRDGEERWVGIYLRSIFSPVTGELDGAVGTIDDITELIAAERVMREAKEQAEMANKTKSSFLATMSHELRTPMNAILGLTDVVLGGNLDADQVKHLRMVKSSASSLLEIIEEVLLYSNLEAGKVKLEPARFEVREVLGQALAPLLFRAMENQLELNWRVQPDLPSHLVGDSLRLKQILNQLVGNAVKFTQEGSVTVEVTAMPPAGSHPPRAGQVCIQFSVTDTGVGISEEYRRNLFAVFSRSDGNHNRRHSGTGLGLAVSARILELMGGRIWLDETLQKGCRFFFEVWFNLPEEPKAVPNAARPRTPGKEVLVAEDNTVNQHLIRHILTKMGHHPTIVGNGRLCVEAWQRTKYDLILMDIQMPEMSGIEATIVIRENEKVRGGHIPIIAVTANAVLGDRDLCLQSGMDEYITKPIRNTILEEAIDRFTRQQTRPPMEPEKPALEALMDPAKALEGADNDADLLRSLMELFLLRTPECLTRLEKAMAAEDASEVMMQAHSLKGALRMLCAPKVEQVAYIIEKAGRLRTLEEARVNISAIKPLLARLYEEITTVLKERHVTS